jgi:hypothetical protein
MHERKQFRQHSGKKVYMETLATVYGEKYEEHITYNPTNKLNILL